MPGYDVLRARARAQLAIRRVAALVGGGRGRGTACARQVRWVQADSIQAQLDSRNIVLLSNIGDALPACMHGVGDAWAQARCAELSSLPQHVVMGLQGVRRGCRAASLLNQ